MMNKTTMSPDTSVICGHCGKSLVNCRCGTTMGSEWISRHLKSITHVVWKYGEQE